MVRRGGIEPPQPMATGSLIQRVYQFRHPRLRNTGIYDLDAVVSTGYYPLISEPGDQPSASPRVYRSDLSLQTRRRCVAEVVSSSRMSSASGVAGAEGIGMPKPSSSSP